MKREEIVAPVVVDGVVELQGQNPLVRIDAAAASRVRAEWRRAVPVCVRVNGEPATPWRTNMMPAGDGTYLLYLHGEMRQASSVAVGDSVTLELVFDEEYRNGPLHEMPTWFAEPLAANETASTNWRRLAPSRQKEVLRYFAGLQSDEAKARNVERVLRVLGGAPERFMGRDWREGA